MLISSCCPRPDATDEPTQAAPGRQPRRGATAIEYAVALSTIFVVVILTVQHLGSVVSGSLTKSASSTNFNKGDSKL
jgi:Flp pilus assembly pilin Flp